MKKISGILMLLVYVCVATTLLNDKFVTAFNMENLTRWSSLFGILGIGVAFVIITGGIDLSIGSVIGLVGCILPMLVVASQKWGSTATIAGGSFLFGGELLLGGCVWLAMRLDSRDGPRPQSYQAPLLVVGAGILTLAIGVLAAWTAPPAWLAIVFVLIISLGVAVHLGLFHGLLITQMKLRPFVVTLCGLLFYRGFARWITGDQTQGFGSGYNDSLRLIATAKPCSVARVVEVAGVLVALFFAVKLLRRTTSREDGSRGMTVFGLVVGLVLALLGASRFESGIEFDFLGQHVDLNPPQVPGAILSWLSWLVIPAFFWLLIRAAMVSGRALAAPLASLLVAAVLFERAHWFANLSETASMFEPAWHYRFRIAAVFVSLAVILAVVAWFANTALKHGRRETQLPLAMTAATALAWILSHKFGASSLADTLLGEMLVPAPFFVMVALGVVAAVFLNLTIYGRYLLALGQNEQAARFSGIETNGLVIAAYMICAGTAGLGGILFALDGNSVQPSGHGNFYELYAIAAAVLGGCSLRGGEGSILGVVIGAAVMRVLYNSINILGIPSQLEFAIIGAVILLGVSADELVKRLSARRRALEESRAKASKQG